MKRCVMAILAFAAIAASTGTASADGRHGGHFAVGIQGHHGGPHGHPGYYGPHGYPAYHHYYRPPVIIHHYAPPPPPPVYHYYPAYPQGIYYRGPDFGFSIGF